MTAPAVALCAGRTEFTRAATPVHQLQWREPCRTCARRSQAIGPTAVLWLSACPQDNTCADYLPHAADENLAGAQPA